MDVLVKHVPTDLLDYERHLDEVGLDIDVARNVAVRPRLEKLRLQPGVEARLYDMLYRHGPGNGTGLFLPFDQKSAEHGPGHEFLWKRHDAGADEIRLRGEGAADIRTIAELVNTGNFSGYVLHPGTARKSKHLFRPDIPLIYKIDGHLTQPAPAEIQSTVGSIEDALQLGASAIGISLYVGSKHIRDDLERAGRLREQSLRAGLPLVVWAYPRGPGLDSDMEGFEGQTQADSLLWVHYAVVVASEVVGADIVKTKFPEPVKPANRKAYDTYVGKLAKRNSSFAAYKYLEPQSKPEKPETPLTHEQHVYRAGIVVGSVPSTIVIFSGGPKAKGDPTEALVKETAMIMDAGGEGGIYGRKVWGVPVEDGLRAAGAITDVMRRPEYARKLRQPRFVGYN